MKDLEKKQREELIQILKIAPKNVERVKTICSAIELVRTRNPKLFNKVMENECKKVGLF